MNPVRGALLYIASAVLLLMILSPNCWAQSTTQTPSVRSFLSGLVGEWIGTCEQCTKNDKPDKQYFHAVLKQLDDGSFECKFQLFRQGDKGLSLCGETSIVTSFDSKGSAVSKIKGTTEVMVSDKPTDSRHELTETLTCTEGGLQGKGSGRISVSGTPLGLGKNGQVKSSESVWSIKDGVLSIDQKMSVSFKAVIVTKKVDVQTHYTAKRGSDVKTLLDQKTQTAEPPKPPEVVLPVN